MLLPNFSSSSLIKALRFRQSLSHISCQDNSDEYSLRCRGPDVHHRSLVSSSKSRSWMMRSATGSLHARGR